MNIAERQIPPAAGRVLVTGGAGFIGSHFVDHLLAEYPGLQVTVLDALTYAGSVDNLPMDKIEFVYGDVRNPAQVDEVVGRCEYVVHFAAETHVTRSIAENRVFFETDVLGTQTVLNACLKHRQRIRKVVHISTSEVYGTASKILGQAAMAEDHPLEPMSPYAAAKCGADRLAYSYAQTYGLPVVIARPFNNYGPRQHVEKVVPRFITSALMGERLPVHGNGTAERDFVFVGDTVRAIAKLMVGRAEWAGMAFNIASGQAFSVTQIAHLVLNLVHPCPILEGNIAYLPDRPGQVWRHIGDTSLAERLLGWKAATPWLDGMGATVDWFTQNQDRWAGQLWARTCVIKTTDGKLTAH